jgi:hypothetical protein
MTKNGKTLTCLICDKNYYVPKYRIRIAKFCSRECHSIYQMQLLGKFTNNYKGGHLRKDGYRLVIHNGKLCYEHRLLVEKLLGRKLKKSEIVHHKDGNKMNNKVENLEITNRSKHLIMHNPLDKRWHKNSFTNHLGEK